MNSKNPEAIRQDPPEPTGGQMRAKGLRGWIPATILLLAAANELRIRLSSQLDSNFKNMQTWLTLVITVPLLIVWFVFFTRLRWRTRLMGLLLFAVGFFGITKILRFDGAVDGSGKPRIAWRWTPKRDGNVGPLNAALWTNSQPALAASFDSPAYLGSERQGVVKGIELERDWRAHPPKELWRQPIGLGWSGFAVAGSRALTQERRGGSELVVCYELATGHVLWAHTNLVQFDGDMGGNGPRATPTIAGSRVYALGATGILDCLDEGTGTLIWSRETLKENALPNLVWGKACSPLAFDNLVVVNGGFTNASTLLAYDRNDGSLLWRAGTDKASFSSPTLATLSARRQIVSVNAGSVSGHDPANGLVLWEYAWGGDKWPKCAQPVVLDGDRVFVSASFNAGCALLQLKAAADGRLSVTEHWKSRIMKSEFSNLVARDGFLYGLDDGILACVELASGERKWKEGRYGHGQVLLVGDVLVVQTEPGPVVLVEANPSEYRELARVNALSSKTWNVPALAGEFLLARNDQEAVCYRLPLRAKAYAAAKPVP